MRWKKWANPFADISVASLDATREAAASGDVKAQYRLGRMYEEGRWTDRDDRSAAQWYQRAADRGHAEAQFRLGRMYHEGRGLDRDDKKAVRWLRLAAEQGVAEARRYLETVENGAAVETGAGGSGDRPEVRAENGKAGPQAAPTRPSIPDKIFYAIIVPALLYHLGAAYFIIDRYKRADRQSPPPKTAPATCAEYHGLRMELAHNLCLAEKKGDLEAGFRVASLYEGGRLVPQDYEQAVAWYRKGAARGHLKSLYRLGVMYEYGHGVPKDEEEALKCYRKAADQGDREAQSLLGWRYQFGEGVPKDEAQAIEWYRRAAAQGDRGAKDHLKALKKRRAGR